MCRQQQNRSSLPIQAQEETEYDAWRHPVAMTDDAAAVASGRCRGGEQQAVGKKLQHREYILVEAREHPHLFSAITAGGEGDLCLDPRAGRLLCVCAYYHAAVGGRAAIGI